MTTHFFWANRLVLFAFFSLYLFTSIFLREPKLSLLFGAVGYGLLAFVISITALSYNQISKALVLLVDSALLRFLAAYNGLKVSTLGVSDRYQMYRELSTAKSHDLVGIKVATRKCRLQLTGAYGRKYWLLY